MMGRSSPRSNSGRATSLGEPLEATASNRADHASRISIEVTRHQSSHGPINKTITLQDGKPVSSANGQIYRGWSFRTVLADWRMFAKLINETPLDTAWSLGAMRADRADKCALHKDMPQAREMMEKRADVITRTRDLIDYRPDDVVNRPGFAGGRFV